MAVKELYALVGIDPEGNEGVVVVKISEEVAAPLVAETREVIEQYRPLAVRLAQTFKKVVISRFTTREDVETIS